MKVIICTDMGKCLSYIKQNFKNLEECYDVILIFIYVCKCIKIWGGLPW